MNTAIVFVDAPDPDNFILVASAASWAKRNASRQVFLVITGRPVGVPHSSASSTIESWRWNKDSSLLHQRLSAARFAAFLQKSNLPMCSIFDGGIAPLSPVPHHVHLADHIAFGDIDPIIALSQSPPVLQPQEALIERMLALDNSSVIVLVGGPMTGLSEIIQRCPEVTSKFKSLHAMFGTFGTIELMAFEEEQEKAEKQKNNRNGKQFNVAADPAAAHYVLMGGSLPPSCEVYLYPTEVTRRLEISFENPFKLREFCDFNKSGELSPLSSSVCSLYDVWYDKVLCRRSSASSEPIYVHDFVSSLALSFLFPSASSSPVPTERSDLFKEIYEWIPIEIDGVPYLQKDREMWGQLDMKKIDEAAHDETLPHVFAAANLKTPAGSELYLQALTSILKNS